ncbi:ATP-dependent DNA ligase [Microbacterium sp. YY-01]|uniref:DUF7882 family protein n=1 Tax=Microbacterium sp. YY-01 TaxID=3421634 RepID=UPI003D166CD3
MGKFIYDETVKVEVEDRTLAHLQIVIGTKLRRGESFYFTWREDASVGGGRTSVWLHQAVPLVYKYHGSRRPALNTAWIDALAYTANSPSGLRLVPEPSELEARRPSSVAG